MKNITSTLKYLTFLIFVFPPVASAHTPLFPANNNDPKTAIEIKNPLKSWVMYATLKENKVDYYKMEFKKGQRIELEVMSTKVSLDKGFFPTLVILVPGEVNVNKKTPAINIPNSYSPVFLDEKKPKRASFEPFSPGWFYELGGKSITAPKDGIYYIAIFDKNGYAGNYSIAIGFNESFTFSDWIMIPVKAHSIYAWEGQNKFITWLPLIFLMLAGLFLLIRRIKINKSPENLSNFFAWFAGFAFIGTSLDKTCQLIISVTQTGFTSEIIITILIITAGFVPGFITLKYAITKKTILNSGGRIGLFMTGILGLLVWSGALLGPALVFLAASIPKRIQL